MTDNTRGAILMILSMAAFTLNDTCMKALAGEMELMQALTIRGAITIALLLVIALWRRELRFDLPRRDWALIALRTASEVFTAYFFLTALYNMPLANVTAILQALPLTVTLAGAVFLGESVGWRRIVAILLGFVGVMLIVRPGPDGFDAFAIYALVAVGFITVRDLASRRLSTKTPSMVVALSAAVGVFLYSSIASAQIAWVPMTMTSSGLLAGASVFIVGGYLFSVMVMRVGDIGFIAPFRYTGLVAALILGFVVFGDWPDALTLLGAAIVVAMGVFTFYRERRVATRIAARTRA